MLIFLCSSLVGGRNSQKSFYRISPNPTYLSPYVVIAVSCGAGGGRDAIAGYLLIIVVPARIRVCSYHSSLIQSSKPGPAPDIQSDCKIYLRGVHVRGNKTEWHCGPGEALI